MPIADRMLLSMIPYDGPADTFFPEFDRAEWAVVRETAMDGFVLRELRRSSARDVVEGSMQRRS